MEGEGGQGAGGAGTLEGGQGDGGQGVQNTQTPPAGGQGEGGAGGQNTQTPPAGGQGTVDLNWALDAKDFEGMAPEFIDGYSGIAKELGLSKEHAIQLLNRAAELAGQQDQAVVQAQQQDWIAKVKADSEFGGSNLNANLAIAKKALDTWGGDGLKEVLESTGLGNHPEVIRFFYRAGKALSEDGFQKGGAGTGKPVTFNDVAAKLFPSM